MKTKEKKMMTISHGSVSTTPLLLNLEQKFEIASL